MPVYMIVETEVRDAKVYAQYLEKAREVVLRFGGTYISRGGKVISLSSSWVPQRIAIIEFESLQRLKDCFNSPEYKQISGLREKSASSRAIVVEGC